MGVTASVTPVMLEVEPGREATAEVQVHNSGTVVDSFELSVLGDTRGWASVEPATLSLYPGTDGTARLHFRPPRSSATPTGIIPFAVRVASHEDPDGSTVEEGSIRVGAYTERTAELVPRTSRGRRRAVYEVAVDNRGNGPLEADLEAVEADGHLRFRFEPPSVVVAPGAAAFAKAITVVKEPFWKGQPKTRPFKVRVGPALNGTVPLMLDGIMLHEPRLPRWFWKAVVLALAAILALVALWFLVLRPTIHDQAKAAAQGQTAQAAKAATQAKQAAATAQQAAGGGAAAAKPGGGAGSGGGSGGGGSGAGSGGGSGGAAPGPTTTETGGRISLNVPAGQGGSQALPGIPAKKSFLLTDAVFENPNGDAGMVQLLRGGSVIFEISLANFRDLDYHFVAPIAFPAGTPVVFAATCGNPAPVPCQPAVYLGGYLS